MIRTSEFWMALLMVAGIVVVNIFKLASQEDWNTKLYPALAAIITYIVGRLTSKLVKRVF